MSSSVPILDLTDLLNDTDGDMEFVVPWLTSLQEKINASLNEMKTKLEEQDPQSVRQIAHTIKGSAGNIGAMQLFEVALKIEEAARTNDLESCQAQFSQFASIWQTTHQAIKDWLGKNA